MGTKGKVEALRMKKKLETDVVDLGVALEHANAANAESQRNIKRIQTTIREIQAKYEDEVRAKSAAQDSLIAAERRVNANQNALEEARTLLEQENDRAGAGRHQRDLVPADLHQPGNQWRQVQVRGRDEQPRTRSGRDDLRGQDVRGQGPEIHD